MIKIPLFLLLFAFGIFVDTPSVFSQNLSDKKLVSGPMLGYVEHHEVQIWLEVAQNVQKVEIHYNIVGKTTIIKASVDAKILRQQIGRASCRERV